MYMMNKKTFRQMKPSSGASLWMKLALWGSGYLIIMTASGFMWVPKLEIPASMG